MSGAEITKEVLLETMKRLMKNLREGGSPLELALAKIMTSVKVKMDNREKIGIAKIIHNIA